VVFVKEASFTSAFQCVDEWIQSTRQWFWLFIIISQIFLGCIVYRGYLIMLFLTPKRLQSIWSAVVIIPKHIFDIIMTDRQVQ